MDFIKASGLSQAFTITYLFYQLVITSRRNIAKDYSKAISSYCYN